MEMTDILKKHFADVEDRIGALPTQVKETIERVNEMEQKMAQIKRSGGGPVRLKSWGEQFTAAKSADLEILAKQRGQVSMEMQTPLSAAGATSEEGLFVKATLTSATTDSAGSVGDLIVPTMDAAVMMPRRRLTIRNLLNVVKTTSGSVEYPKQTGRPAGAAPVAEGAAKPESDMKFDIENVPMRVIAHWTKASRQVLSDIPQLANLIDTELRYGLAIQEETQLLFGDGTGQNLEGMVSQATAYSAAFVPDMETAIDTIGLAILQAALTNVPPDGIIIHPSDWWRMRLTKNSAGDYILGDPNSAAPASLFGLPVVPTEAMTADKFLVGSFQSQTLYDRWEARVETGYVNDDFTRNLVTVLAEERIGFAAKRPEALIYGDLGFAS